MFSLAALTRASSPLALLVLMALGSTPARLYAAAAASSPTLAAPAPGWVKDLRYIPLAPDGYVYAVGTATRVSSREDALSAAWNAAIIQLLRTSLPELQRVHELSQESLHSARWERRAELESQDISLQGIEEVATSLSPWVIDESTPQAPGFSAYRLLRWSVQHIETERKALARRQSTLPPTSQDLLLDASLPPSPSPPSPAIYALAPSPAKTSSSRVVSAISFGAGLLFTVMAINENRQADAAYERYQSASTSQQARTARRQTDAHANQSTVHSLGAVLTTFLGALTYTVPL
jgi:hypothetical protein